MANLAKKDITEIAETTGFDTELALLFHAQYCDKATGTEFRDFLQKAKDFDCDPRKGEIYFIKYKADRPGTCCIGKNGFVKNAVAHPQMNGISQGVTKDKDGNLLSAWCKIYRKDWGHPVEVEVEREEYDSRQGNWAKMPVTMLKKVALSQCARLAFPDRFNGVLDISEAGAMDMVAEPVKPVRSALDSLKQDMTEMGTSEKEVEAKISDPVPEQSDPATEDDIEKFFSHCAGKSIELTEEEVGEIEPGIEKERLNEIFTIALKRKGQG